MPAPHSSDAVPAFCARRRATGTTFQPCAFSIDTAVEGLYGNGLVVALAVVYGESGADGIGP